MDGETKVHLSEGVPLNSTGAANIFLNTGKNSKLSNDGTIIQVKTEKPADLGVHINTTFSVASSKKIKHLVIANLIISFVCILMSLVVGIYYWTEISSMKKQIDILKGQISSQNDAQQSLDKAQSSPLVYQKPIQVIERRHPRMEENKDDASLTPRRYFVEDLGEDMLLIDSSKKNPQKHIPAHELTIPFREQLVAQFNGAAREINLEKQTIIGPWTRDSEVSSKNSESKIQMDGNFVTVQEGGVYLIYVQVVYLSKSPSCFYVWARTKGSNPRLIATCASADDSSGRRVDKSQLSCGTTASVRLQPGDTINIAQREQNRTFWLRPGYSYFGLIKLNS